MVCDMKIVSNGIKMMVHETNIEIHDIRMMFHRIKIIHDAQIMTWHQDDIS